MDGLGITAKTGHARVNLLALNGHQIAPLRDNRDHGTTPFCGFFQLPTARNQAGIDTILLYLALLLDRDRRKGGLSVWSHWWTGELILNRIEVLRIDHRTVRKLVNLPGFLFHIPVFRDPDFLFLEPLAVIIGDGVGCVE